MPDGSCHGLMSSEAGSRELCRCSRWQSCELQSFVEDRGQWKEGLCTVSKGVPCLCELNKPSVTQAS